MRRHSSIPLLLLAATTCLFLSLCEAHRVAPGVPPENYQQNEPPSHQAPQYQAPTPLQQHYGQPLAPQNGEDRHQTGTEQGHDHLRPLDASGIEEDGEHIAEHMPVPIDTSKMTKEELQFHHFKMYDTDGNRMLDGCEFMKPLMHAHGVNAQPMAHKDEDINRIIDQILAKVDVNGDGYVDWGEFVVAKGPGSSGN